MMLELEIRWNSPQRKISSWHRLDWRLWDLYKSGIIHKRRRWHNTWPITQQRTLQDQNADVLATWDYKGTGMKSRNDIKNTYRKATEFLPDWIKWRTTVHNNFKTLKTSYRCSDMNEFSLQTMVWDPTDSCNSRT